eukprot:926702-Pyramimonas_sp.AAC.1
MAIARERKRWRSLVEIVRRSGERDCEMAVVVIGVSTPWALQNGDIGYHVILKDNMLSYRMPRPK